ncbi:MAG: lipoate--protein ligase [Clostridiales bacterium]|nr:lipoate--protein ligase [Clostridiales bacterium]
MKIYRGISTDPYCNLASEEVLLDTEDGEIFMLWQNGRSVILGRNQNAYAEVNLPFVEEHGIPVVRRLTGGGAVFHDLGNLNFTFIVPRERCPELDFARFTHPIAEVLRSLGVPAELSGRNDLVADGRKISGNAQCVWRDRVMHHGTLLVAADLSFMDGALRADADKLKSKGIKSVRSRVGNLSEFLPGLDAGELARRLEDRFLGGGAERAAFTGEQRAGIEKLAREKYRTWEWNFGASGTFGQNVKRRFPYGSVELSFEAEHGVLVGVRLMGDFFGVRPAEELESALLGCRLIRSELTGRLGEVGEYIHGATPDEIAGLFEA